MTLPNRQLLVDLLRIVAVVLIALAIGFVITSLVSEEPVAAFRALLTGPLPRLSLEDGVQVRGMNRFGNWIEESITLILLGLSVAVVFRAKQFSLGAEGQLFLGALAAGAVALFVDAPIWLHIPLALVAAGVVGFLWGLVPGLLKAYLSVDEIVSTLMLNIIAIQIYQLLLIEFLRDRALGFIGSPPFPNTAVLPVIIPRTRVTIMLYITILAVAATWFLLRRTPLGYEIRLIGANIRFAEYGGIRTRRTVALSMAISGVLAGLAGAHLVLGLLGRVTLGLSPNIGFEGIVVALLARNNPIGVLFAGLFYGYLRTGASIMERSSDVTREVVLLVQAVIILLVTAERLFPLIQEWRRKRRDARKLLAESQRLEPELPA